MSQLSIERLDLTQQQLQQASVTRYTTTHNKFTKLIPVLVAFL